MRTAGPGSSASPLRTSGPTAPAGPGNRCPAPARCRRPAPSAHRALRERGGVRARRVPLVGAARGGSSRPRLSPAPRQAAARTPPPSDHLASGLHDRAGKAAGGAGPRHRTTRRVVAGMRWRRAQGAGRRPAAARHCGRPTTECSKPPGVAAVRVPGLWREFPPPSPRPHPQRRDLAPGWSADRRGEALLALPSSGHVGRHLAPPSASWGRCQRPRLAPRDTTRRRNGRPSRPGSGPWSTSAAASRRRADGADPRGRGAPPAHA